MKGASLKHTNNSMLMIGATGCGVYRNSALASQFFCNFQTFLKHKIYFNYIIAKLSLGYKCWDDLQSMNIIFHIVEEETTGPI